jgi:hypothetical protein
LPAPAASAPERSCSPHQSASTPPTTACRPRGPATAPRRRRRRGRAERGRRAAVPIPTEHRLVPACSRSEPQLDRSPSSPPGRHPSQPGLQNVVACVAPCSSTNCATTCVEVTVPVRNRRTAPPVAPSESSSVTWHSEIAPVPVPRCVRTDSHAASPGAGIVSAVSSAARGPFRGEVGPSDGSAVGPDVGEGAGCVGSLESAGSVVGDASGSVGSVGFGRFVGSVDSVTDVGSSTSSPASSAPHPAGSTPGRPRCQGGRGRSGLASRFLLSPPRRVPRRVPR